MSEFDKVISLDPVLITILVGLVVPILTALVTKLHAGSGLKAVTSFFLSALTAVVVEVVTMSDFTLKAVLLYFFFAFVPATAAYYGLWKPTGVAPGVQSKTAAFGVGSGVPPVAPPVVLQPH